MVFTQAQILDQLKRLLYSSSLYNLSTQENSYIHEHGIKNFIFQCATSNQFKKWKISSNLELNIRNSIDTAVSLSRPLHFILPFGGYKLWHHPVYCEIGWSEFFAIAYYSQYLAPIVASYSPGVIFEFITDDTIINSMDKVPKADIEKYFKSFNELITSFQAFFPSNLKFNLLSVSDNAFSNNSTNISDWYLNLTRRSGETKILVSCTPIPEAIALGSTQENATMFWSGIGLYEQRDDSLIKRIVTKNIWDEISQLPHQEIPIQLLNLHNLNSIYVYPEKFGIGKYHRSH